MSMYVFGFEPFLECVEIKLILSNSNELLNFFTKKKTKSIYHVLMYKYF